MHRAPRDVEVIRWHVPCGAIWASDGPTELNSLGVPDERKAHRQALMQLPRGAPGPSGCRGSAGACTATAHLDTKNPAMQELVEGAPRLLDYLGEGSLKPPGCRTCCIAGCGRPALPW